MIFPMSLKETMTMKRVIAVFALMFAAGLARAAGDFPVETIVSQAAASAKSAGQQSSLSLLKRWKMNDIRGDIRSCIKTSSKAKSYTDEVLGSWMEYTMNHEYRFTPQALKDLQNEMFGMCEDSRNSISQHYTELVCIGFRLRGVPVSCR